MRKRADSARSAHGAKPIASSLPFCLAYADDGTPRVAFHVARNNPLAKLADGETPWLMTVNTMFSRNGAQSW